MKFKLVSVFFVLGFCGITTAFSNGNIISCSERGNHVDMPPQETPFPFFVWLQYNVNHVINENDTATFHLRSDIGFKGILIQFFLKNGTNEPYGSFGDSEKFMAIDCLGKKRAALVHKDSTEKHEFDFNWTAPPHSGEFFPQIIFVQNLSRHWGPKKYTLTIGVGSPFVYFPRRGQVKRQQSPEERKENVIPNKGLDSANIWGYVIYFIFPIVIFVILWTCCR